MAGKYNILVEMGLVSEGQACVVEALEKIDHIDFECRGSENYLGYPSQIFRDKDGRVVEVSSPPNDRELLSYKSFSGNQGDYHEDAVYPKGRLTSPRTSQMTTVHNKGNTNDDSNFLAQLKSGTLPPPKPQADIVGGLALDASSDMRRPLRPPTERENDIFQAVAKCYERPAF